MGSVGWFGTEGAASVVVAAVAALIALVAALFARRANHVSSSAYVSALVDEWGTLSSDWILSLLLACGSDDYFVPATDAQRENARKLATQAKERGAKHGVADEIHALRPLAPSLRRVTRFLARCGELLVLGRLDPGEIYMVLGPDVARHHAALRRITGADTARPNAADEQRTLPSGALDKAPREESFHGEQDLVLALVDLLWAEAAKRGDNWASSFLGIARHKRQNATGRTCRRRVRRLVLERGWRLTHAYRLSCALRNGEYVPVPTMRRDFDQLMPGDEQLARRRRLPRPFDRWMGRLAFRGKRAIPPRNC